ncbi:DUF1838 family protein [Altererythrobacter sp. GH1-8]|uniref:DUF1838 family protein n=1 Tax=Altererythrobacter sp. GH1-8 TaxID=3349333 RepID=UPI00374D9891
MATTGLRASNHSSRVTTLDPLSTVMRMRGSADGALTMSYLDAVREIVVDGDIVPFCDLKAFVVARYVPVGSLFEAQILEVAYYVDRKTGKQIESFQFPGQSEPVAVPKYRTGPLTVRFANQLDEWETVTPGNPGEASADFAPPSRVRLQRSVETPWVSREKLLVRTNEYGRAYTSGSSKPAVFYREWMIYEALAEDIFSTQSPNIPAEYSYTAISSWRPWMKMDQVSGHTTSNGRGRKIFSPAELPHDIRQLVMQHDPDILDDPAGALSKLATRG